MGAFQDRFDAGIGDPHGGDLFVAQKLFGGSAKGWLDLSTGVNPRAYPHTTVRAASLRQLPQHLAMSELLDGARQHYGVPATLDVVAGSGSQVLIQALARVREPGRVAVLSPTYGEHAAQWSSAGHKVELIASLHEGISHDVLILSNPNNPDARVHRPGQLLEVIAQRPRAKQLLIVDEAFSDAVPHTSLIPHLPPPMSATPSASTLSGRPQGGEGVVVLRSFGKFFGLAGVRLGFAIGPQALLDGIRAYLGPWPVNGPALEIGARALVDAAWIAQTTAWLEIASSRVDNALRAAGYHIAGSTALFSLLEDANAAKIFGQLASRGIFTRRFDAQRNWLRIGLPGSDHDLGRLISALGPNGKHGVS